MFGSMVRYKLLYCSHERPRRVGRRMVQWPWIMFLDFFIQKGNERIVGAVSGFNSFYMVLLDLYGQSQR